MATINQIQSRIATANARRTKQTDRIVMYACRTEKALAFINKKYNRNFSLSDLSDCVNDYHGHKIHDYVLNGSNDIDWSDTYKATNNFQYLREAERERERINREIEGLKNQLAELECAAQQTNDLHTGSLAIAIAQAMSQFRGPWFDYMRRWHRSHYEYIHDIEPVTRTRHTRARNCESYFSYKAGHIRTCGWLRNLTKQYGRILSDPALKFKSIDDYMYKVEQELKQEWQRCCDILVDKCNKFGLNESAIRATDAQVTDKGFEVRITDGTDRRIYARIIWAAENSELVSPHTRYIVTEKKIR